MKTIVVGSTKGGTGKTTIATNLAVGLVQQGKKILLVDADTQSSAMAWRALREDDSIAAVSITEPRLADDIPAIGKGFDFVIVDVGGRDSAVLRSAFLAADLILVPVLASPYDIWAAGDTVNIIKQAEIASGTKIPTRLIVNQVIMHHNIVRDAITALDDGGLPPYITILIGQRVAYKEATAKGLSVLELANKKTNKKAAEEMARVVDAVNKLIIRFS